MTLGAVLLALAVAAGAASLALPLLARTRLPRSPLARTYLATGAPGVVAAVGARSRGAARVLARAHVALTLAALLLLALAFLAGDLSLLYVWAHTRLDHAVWYRLAGVWGGEEGTVLLWAAGAAAASLLVARGGRPVDARAAAALLALSTTLAAFALAFGVFDATPPDVLARASAGRGLADVLLTPLMVVHPPVQFVAYALAAVPGAYAFAWLTLPDAQAQGWSERAFPWARRAWLLATLGLGLGALWAYYVLSFGGYWAWDPVETGNLLPWLALTIFLHAGKHHARFGDFTLAAPLLALAAPLLTFFATFATRSGLWVSVHAFTDPTDRFEPDAGARLLAIVDAHPPTRAFLALLTVAVAASVALLLLRHAPALRGGWRAWARAHALVLLALGGAAALDPAFAWGALLQAAQALGGRPVGLALALGALLLAPPALLYLQRDEPPARRPSWLAPRPLMAAGVLVLAVGLAATLLLLTQVVNGPDRGLFDARAPFVALPLVAVLTVTLALPVLGKRGAVALAAAGAVAGAAAWAAFPQARVLALSAPLLLACAAAAVLRLARSQGADAPRALRAAGALQLAAALLGFAFWSNPPSWLHARGLPPEWAAPAAAVGLALSALALGGAVACLRARGRRLALAGALAAALATGGVLGLASLALAWRAPFRAGRLPEGVRLREAGTWLVHLALAVGLLGYAASTYSQERATFTAVPLDAQGEVGPYAFALGDARLSEDAAGALAEVVVPVALLRDGEPAGEAALAFERGAGGVWQGRLEVRRGLAEDLYLTPLAFHTPQGWVGAQSVPPAGLQGSPVDQVSFTVAVLPLVGLVWAGLWGMLAGMGLVMLGAALPREADARAPAGAQAPSEEAATAPP